MRTIAFAAVILVGPLALHGGAALAQNATVTPVEMLNGRPVTDAPVSSIGPETMSRSERLSGSELRSSDAGPVDGTPFSAAPSGSLGGEGGDVGGRLGNSDSRYGGTPNLGK